MADGGSHTCTCESGYIGEHCAPAFTISGAITYNGVYSQTAHVCNGKPVYQKGGEDGYVLFQPSGLSYWEVSLSERRLDCMAAGYLMSYHGDCPASPDGASCAGKWYENTGDCDRGSVWCPNPKITVVASPIGARPR